MITNIIEAFFGIVLILSSLGVISARKPVHSSLFFLVTLLTLAFLFMELSAQFISVMQILVYAGAILVIFMFVIVLFQDAHHQIELHKPRSGTFLLFLAASLFLLCLIFIMDNLIGFPLRPETLPENYGTAQGLGEALYLDFFFPFEAVILLFLIALVGALFIAKKERRS